jgi:hypothetical protein
VSNIVIGDSRHKTVVGVGDIKGNSEVESKKHICTYIVPDSSPRVGRASLPDFPRASPPEPAQHIPDNRPGESGRDARPTRYALRAARNFRFALIPQPSIVIGFLYKTGLDRIIDRIIELLGIIFVVPHDVIVGLILPDCHPA